MLWQGGGLPQAWAGQTAWRILDTRFSRGFNFLSTCQAWKSDPLRPHMLHYVALTSAPPSLDELRASAEFFPELRELLQELAPQWFGLLPGFHRFTLDKGWVLLTLCVGDLTAMLRQQQFNADTVYLDPGQAAPLDSTAASAWRVRLAVWKPLKMVWEIVAVAPYGEL